MHSGSFYSLLGISSELWYLVRVQIWTRAEEIMNLEKKLKRYFTETSNMNCDMPLFSYAFLLRRKVDTVVKSG